MTKLMTTAEPFLFAGQSNVGVLLTHGFTGTPKEMRWMGEYLNREHGFTCLGIRLTGHATQVEDMIRSRYTDWVASVEDGYHMLASTGKHVYLAGLSMGGILSLHAAAKFPVRGVIAMAAPYALPNDWRLAHADLISRFIPFRPKSDRSPGESWFGDAWKEYHRSYEKNPVRSIGQLNLLLGEMRAALPHITAPALLIYSRDDIYLPLGSLYSLEQVYAHLGSTRKEQLVIEGSGHVVTEEPKREQVFKAAAEFILHVECQLES
jgi:carboxylesterase